MKKNNKSELLDNSKIGVSKEANKGSDFKQSLIDMFIEARDRLKADKRHLIGVKKAIKESEINYNEVNAYLINEQLKKAGIFGKDTKTTKVFTIKQGAKLGIGNLRTGAKMVAYSYLAILKKGSKTDINFVMRTPVFLEKDFIS